METAKQVSVFLENKPGRLANVLRALEKQKINVTGMTVMDSHEHSVLRLVTSDAARTVAVLKEMGANFTNAEVLLVELRNQPGALAHLCEVLAAEHINIDYCYCSAGGRNGRTYGIFKVSSVEKAQRVLAGAGNNSAKRRIEKRPLRDRRSYQTPR
jgi:hypothetical protein